MEWLIIDRIDFSSYPKFQSSLQHCVLTAIVNDPLLHDCDWFMCVLRSTISAVSAWLYLPFVLIVSSVFYLMLLWLINDWLIDITRCAGRIRGLAASADGVRLRAKETKISAALWALEARERILLYYYLKQKLLMTAYIGNCIWEIDWYQNEWPWPLFRGRINVMSTTASH